MLAKPGAYGFIHDMDGICVAALGGAPANNLTVRF